MELTPAVVVLVPVVIALTSLVKMYVDSRYAPVVSLVFGVAGSFLFPGVTVAITILSGIVIGLTASGLFSGVKTVAGN